MPGNNDLIWGYFPLAIAAFSIPSSGDLRWYKPISGGKMRGGLKEGIRIPLQEKRFFDLWFQRRTVHHHGREVWQQVCLVGLAVSKLPYTK